MDMQKKVVIGCSGLSIRGKKDGNILGVLLKATSVTVVDGTGEKWSRVKVKRSDVKSSLFGTTDKTPSEFVEGFVLKKHIGTSK